MWQLLLPYPNFTAQISLADALCKRSHYVSLNIEVDDHDDGTSVFIPLVIRGRREM
jgi:hypothetical protein